MTEQRLLEEMLDNIRALRQSDVETKVKLAEISGQLQGMTSIRTDVEQAKREVADHDTRLEALETLRLDARLKKVEGMTFKIVAAALMLVGAIELFDKLGKLLHEVGA